MHRQDCKHTYILFDWCSLPLCMGCSISQMVAHWQCLLQKNCFNSIQFNSINLFKCEIFSTIASTPHTCICKLILVIFMAVYSLTMFLLFRCRLPTPINIRSYALYQQQLARWGFQIQYCFPVLTRIYHRQLQTEKKWLIFFIATLVIVWTESKSKNKHNTAFYDRVLCPLRTIASGLSSCEKKHLQPYPFTVRIFPWFIKIHQQISTLSGQFDHLKTNGNG